MNMKNIKHYWNCKYNPLKVKNIITIFNMFLGFIAIISLLVSLGPLKLKPNIEICAFKNVTIINLKNWTEAFTNKEELNSFFEVFKKNGFKDIENWSKDNNFYFSIDKDFVSKIKDKKQYIKEQEQLSHERLKINLCLAMERAGYLKREDWIKNFKAGEHINNFSILKEIEKEDDLRFYLFDNYFECNFLNNNHCGKEPYNIDFIPKILDNIENIEYRTIAYHNLRHAKKVYSVFKIINKGKISIRNTKIYIDLKDYPDSKILNTLKKDGIQLLVDDKSYKEIEIPFINSNSSKMFIIENTCTLIPKTNITYSYDLQDTINWELAKKLLFRALFFILFIFYIDKRLK
jgi:hypothetical protein